MFDGVGKNARVEDIPERPHWCGNTKCHVRFPPGENPGLCVACTARWRDECEERRRRNAKGGDR